MNMSNQYEPATLGDLGEEGDRLMVFCRDCRHFKILLPSVVNLPKTRSIPSLAGVFRCTKCSSRNTAAEPRYAAQFVNSSRPAGVGWIKPPE